MYFFFENEATIFAKIIRIRKVEQSFSLSQSGNLSSQQEYMLNSLHEYNSEMDDQDGSLNVWKLRWKLWSRSNIALNWKNLR